MTRAAVLGAGSWGTAFAKVLTDAGNDVTLWARRPELADGINATHENPDYLPGLPLPERSGHARRGGGARRRGARRARHPVADAAREPARTGRRCSRRMRRWSA